MILELGLLHRDPGDTQIFSDLMKKKVTFWKPSFMDFYAWIKQCANIIYIDFEEKNLSLRRNNHRIHIRNFEL